VNPNQRGEILADKNTSNRIEAGIAPKFERKAYPDPEPVLPCQTAFQPPGTREDSG